MENDKTTIEKLRGSENYQTWSFAIRSLLELNDLEKCLNGTAASNETDPVKLKKAKAKIILSIESGLYVHIQTCSTALEIWNKLQSMFEDKGLSRRIGLLRKLISINLESSESMDDYISKIVGTAYKLNAIGFEISEEWVGSFLLAGLSDQFRPFIMGIESSGTKITGDSIKTRLFEMATASSTHNQAFVGKQFKKQFKKCEHCGKTNHKSSRCFKWLKNNKAVNNEKGNSNNSPNVFSALISNNIVNGNVVCASSNRKVFYLDSGASQHMVANSEWLNDVRPTNINHICAANNKKLNVTCVGDLTIDINGKAIEVKNVLCVPELAANLLSVSKITEKGNHIKFDREGCSIFNLKNEPLVRATLVDGVYKIVANIPMVLSAKCESDIITWHRKLGHLNFYDVKKIKSNNGIEFKNEENQLICEICIRGKQTQLPFTNIGTRAKDFLELIHTDLSGPYNTSIGGSKYFQTFIDDFSRKVFVYFLKNKDEALSNFKIFKAAVENEKEKKRKILRSDNGGEFVNIHFDKFLKKCGIKHQTTVPYTPQQNGLAERMNRTIKERAKCMMIDAGLDKEKFWAEAVATAVHLINRSPAKGTGKLPEEMWAGLTIDLKYLRIFGTEAMKLIPKVRRKGFDEHSKKLLFVGYCETTKGYRLMDIKTGRVYPGRDVIFLESPVIKKKLETIDVSVTGPAINLPSPRAVGVINQEINQAQEAVGVVNKDEPLDDDTGRNEQNVSDSQDFNNCDTNPNFTSHLDASDRKESGKSRRSERVKAKPTWLQDYVNFASSESNADPITVKEALSKADAEFWKDAMKSEMDSLMENETWLMADLPEGRKAIKTKWVFKTKKDECGNIIRYKARLVAKGCSQTPDIDYGETYSPVIRYSSIRYLIALAARNNLRIDQMDAITAFLQGDLDEEIYIQQPEGFNDSTAKVCRLQKAMYGLKQSGRQWNIKLDKALKDMNLKRSKVDPCVYSKRSNEKVKLVIAVYVDDILILWENEDEMNEIKRSLSTKFKMKDIGEANQCVGLRISRDKIGNYYLDQEFYIKEIIDKFGMTDSTAVSTPSDPNQKLSRDMIPKTETERDQMKHIPYQQLVGALLYLVQGTRPDIAFAVGDVSRYNSTFGKAHWIAAKRILKYLKGTAEFKLKYCSGDMTDINGFADSDYASDLDKRRSCTGYIFLLQNGAISWSSRRQPTVALSTTEAEYMALNAAAQEAIWLKQFGNELGNICPNQPITIFCDNQGALKLAKNDVYQARTKHIDVRHHFIRDKIADSTVQVTYISTNEMVADNLTKAVNGIKQLFCATKSGLIRI